MNNFLFLLIQTHPLLYQGYIQKLKEARKVKNVELKAKSTSSNEVLREKRSKLHQAKLNYAVVQPISNKEKSAVDQLIVIYNINEARPLELVESFSFRAMVSGLNPRANILCVKKLRKLIESEREASHCKLLQTLATMKHVCLAVDIWSTLKHSFMGVTCHWIEEETCKQRSAALACKRFKGWFRYMLLIIKM